MFGSRTVARLAEQVRSRRRRGWLLAGFAAVVVILAVVVLSERPSGDSMFTATVRRGTLTARLVETGVLRPERSITYHSPMAGRETEIVFLAPEGTHVKRGDLIVRLDTSGLEDELQQAIQASNQARAEFQLAEAELDEAAALLESVTEGERALEVDEARINLELTESRVDRLREESEGLKPLLDRGYITRDELRRSAEEFEQAVAQLTMMRRRVELLTGRTYPREQQRARVDLVRRQAGLEQRRQMRTVASQRVTALRALLDGGSIYARQPGLVVYEEYASASAPRKVRVGDRVTASQGVVTIPEVSRMLAESSVRETDVHRLALGQPVTIRVDAFPGLMLEGQVTSIGALARTSYDRPFGGKRFDVVVQVASPVAELRPEMTARLEIHVGERPDILMIPVNAVFERDGVSVVHVLRGSRIETRPVELGESNQFDVEVIAGLREDDRVSLTDTASDSASDALSGSPRAAAPSTPRPATDRE